MNEHVQQTEQEIIPPRPHPAERLGQKAADQRAMIAEHNTVALLNKSEIDQQIATAHTYPRSIKAFRDEAMAMVTLDEAIAKECIYALPRDGKVIEGPSARFAEIMQHAWGNCRAGARVVAEGPEFITAQGVFHDLEKNAAVTFEVQRRITGKHGRFSADMIGVTGNAAASIALRNAILKGIPKAFWMDMYLAARKVIMGDFRTLSNKRAAAMEAFAAYGVTPAEIFALISVRGVEDIAPEHLVTLSGVLTAIKDGDTTPEEAFNRKAPVAPSAPAAPAAPPVTQAPAAPAPAQTAEAETKPGEMPDLPANLDRRRKRAPKAAPEAAEAPAQPTEEEISEALKFDAAEEAAYLDELSSRLQTAPDQEAADDVWAEHEDHSAPRMSDAGRDRALALYQDAGQRQS